MSNGWNQTTLAALLVSEPAKAGSTPNGVGSKGTGLTGMRVRVVALRGDLALRTAPGHGRELVGRCRYLFRHGNSRPHSSPAILQQGQGCQHGDYDPEARRYDWETSRPDRLNRCGNRQRLLVGREHLVFGAATSGHRTRAVSFSSRGKSSSSVDRDAGAFPSVRMWSVHCK